MQLLGATRLEFKLFETIHRVETEFDASELATAVVVALSEAVNELQRLRCTPPCNAAGYLEVGIADGNVVVNLDRDRTGHIKFTPFEARNLARILQEQADELDPLINTEEFQRSLTETAEEENAKASIDPPASHYF